jgi:hypothetical protein
MAGCISFENNGMGSVAIFTSQQVYCPHYEYRGVPNVGCSENSNLPNTKHNTSLGYRVLGLFPIFPSIALTWFPSPLLPQGHQAIFCKIFSLPPVICTLAALPLLSGNCSSL